MCILGTEQPVSHKLYHAMPSTCHFSLMVCDLLVCEPEINVREHGQLLDRKTSTERLYFISEDCYTLSIPYDQGCRPGAGAAGVDTFWSELEPELEPEPES